jgi:zinc protease
LDDLRLGNGLRIIVDHRNAGGAVAVALVVGVGFRSETALSSGLAHLCEHLSCGSDLGTQILAHGGFTNAVTYSDCTVFYSVGLADDLPLHVAHHQARFHEPTITPEIVAHEIDVVTAEVDAAVNGPGMGAFPWFWLPAATWDDHHLGHNGYGDTQSLQSMSMDVISGFWREKYTPANCLLVVSGDVVPGEVLSLIGVPVTGPGGTPSAQRRPVAPVRRSPTLVRNAPPGVHASAVVWQAPDPADTRRFAATIVLAELMANSDGGILDQAVPHGREVGSYVGIFGNPFDVGSPVPWVAEASFGDPSGADSFRQHAVKCLVGVADGGTVEDADLLRVVDQLRLSALRSEDNLLTHALTLGTRTMLHHPESGPPPLDLMLSAVTMRDVRDAAAFLLSQPEVVMRYGLAE